MKNSISRLRILSTIVLLSMTAAHAAESTKEGDIAALEQKRNALREENAQLLKEQIAQEEKTNAELKGKEQGPAPAQAEVPPTSGSAAPAEGGPPRTKVGKETDRIVDQAKDKFHKISKIF